MHSNEKQFASRDVVKCHCVTALLSAFEGGVCACESVPVCRARCAIRILQPGGRPKRSRQLRFSHAGPGLGARDRQERAVGQGTAAVDD